MFESLRDWKTSEQTLLPANILSWIHLEGTQERDGSFITFGLGFIQQADKLILSSASYLRLHSQGESAKFCDIEGTATQYHRLVTSDYYKSWSLSVYCKPWKSVYSGNLTIQINETNPYYQFSGSLRQNLSFNVSNFTTTQQITGQRGFGSNVTVNSINDYDKVNTTTDVTVSLRIKFGNISGEFFWLGAVCFLRTW